MALIGCGGMVGSEPNATPSLDSTGQSITFEHGALIVSVKLSQNAASATLRERAGQILGSLESSADGEATVRLADRSVKVHLGTAALDQAVVAVSLYSAWKLNANAAAPAVPYDDAPPVDCNLWDCDTSPISPNGYINQTCWNGCGGWSVCVWHPADGWMWCSN
jgi:hypothetical protein